MKFSLRYQLQLSVEQTGFLADRSFGHNRMEYFLSLVRRAALKPYPSIIPGSKQIVGVGMVERSVKQLSDDWHLDYKTTREMLKTMSRLGIIATKSSPYTTTIVFPVISGWVVDNTFIPNPYFVRGYDKNNVRNGNLDSTAFASEFNPVMDNSIARYLESLPKGGRGKRKTAASGKVILPNIDGLRLFAEMSAKAEEHADESVTPVENSGEAPAVSVDDEGSVNSENLSSLEETISSESPPVDSSDDKLPADPPCEETEETSDQPSDTDSPETDDEQLALDSDKVEEPLTNVQYDTPTE